MSSYLFITAQLAYKAVLRVLADTAPEGGYRVQALGVSVAALMNTEFIARHVNGAGVEQIVIPGLCKGPLEVIEEKTGCRVVRGPEDLKDLPSFLGGQSPAGPPTDSKLKILAEIVEAPHLSVSQIVERARQYKAAGANIIDIGTEMNGEFSHLKEAIRALKNEEFTVSIDSLAPADILSAAEAGVDMVLSVNSSNIHVAGNLDCKLVIIPDEDGDLGSLFNNAEKLYAMNKDIILDPILSPLLFGFTDAIIRYREVCRRYPEIPVLMGVGNVTELTDADSTGINALLAGVAAELDIDYILTTECSPRTRGSVKEICIARDLMHRAREKGMLPKHIDYSLLTLKDPKPTFYSELELREMQVLVKDRNYRIFTGDQYIYIFNSRVFLRDTNAERLFKYLDTTDSGHAFYLGRELMKAELALKLGKKYVQDRDLRWGYLSDN